MVSSNVRTLGAIRVICWLMRVDRVVVRKVAEEQRFLKSARPSTANTHKRDLTEGHSVKIHDLEAQREYVNELFRPRTNHGALVEIP